MRRLFFALLFVVSLAAVFSTAPLAVAFIAQIIMWLEVTR